MHNVEYNREWLNHNGKTVKINGLLHRLEVRTMQCKYPYEYTGISVYANPVSKNSKHYKEMKAKLGDDWSTDVLASDFEIQGSILEQVK